MRWASARVTGQGHPILRICRVHTTRKWEHTDSEEVSKTPKASLRRFYRVDFDF
ncbi:hypothetical protein BH23CHL4_BH23CHL4_03980 [soil metagenome]